MAATTFQFFWRDRSIAAGYRSGVSLHSHTSYSEESLDLLPHYVGRIPLLGEALGVSESHKSEGKRPQVDFRNAYYNPPVPPRKAYRIEEKQINRNFNLPAMVSLTDHDDARAGTLLRVLDRFRHAPISTEWTVPFGETFFHVGVHNLPSVYAADVMIQFKQFTADPQNSQAKESQLTGLLEMLNSFPKTLVVVNHPLWDEKGIGFEQHMQTLRRLLGRSGGMIHALELNGLRAWRENAQVISLARHLDMPAVGGGDRHGLEPNSIINLSRASTFAEYADEIRNGRESRIVVMPQYREPLGLRMWQMITDVLREYPEHPSGRRWVDRMFVRDPRYAEPVPFLAAWGSEGIPAALRFAASAVQMLDGRSVRWALRLALRQQTPMLGDQKLIA